MGIDRYLFLLLLSFCLAGCAHAPAAAPVRAGAESSQAAPSREELLREAGRKPAAREGDRDDFIDVDDRSALRKTWPMALFIALIAAACGVF